MGTKNNILYKIDWLTVAIYFILVMLGWINIYAAIYNQEHHSIFDISQKYGKQLLWIGAAVIIIIGLFMVKPETFPFFSYPIYGFVIFLLIIVLLVGREINGARSWIEIGSIRLQPAEFTKPATALILAKIMSVYNFNVNKFKDLLKVGVILLTPMLLIILQNDTGSALVYLAFILVLYREGLPSWILLTGVLIITFFILSLLLGVKTVCLISVSTGFIAAFWKLRNTKQIGLALLILTILYSALDFANGYFNIPLFSRILVPIFLASIYYLIYAFRKNLKFIYTIIAFVLSSILFSFSVDYVFNNILGQHQQDRINNLLGIEFDPLGAGYNVNQSLIAIGSGGLTGKGFLQGTQTKYNFVPEQSTDFIFCTVGEEWGFMGSVFVLLMFLWLILRLIKIAEKQRSSFTKIYGYAVASIFFFHVAVNVGMTIGLAPVIGIPLPFFSYGGSSLWSFTILLFIFIILDTKREELIH